MGFGAAAPAIQGLAAALTNPYVLLTLFAVAGIAATVAITALAVKMADAARTARIFLGAVAGNEFAGKRLGATINRLAKDIPIARQALQDIAVQLTNKGLADSNLEHALNAISRSTAVLGSAAGAKLQSIVEKSKELKRFMAQAVDFEGSGISLDDMANALAVRAKTSFAAAKSAIKAGSVDLATGLAALDDATKKKLGKASDKMKLSLTAIGERAGQVFANIFSTLDPEPVLQLLSDMVEMFDENAAAGKAMRAICETMLQPLLNFVGGSGGDAVKMWIEGLVIATLTAAIGFFTLRNAVRNFANAASEKFGELVAKAKKLGKDIIQGILVGVTAGAPAVGNAIEAAVSSGLDKGAAVAEVRSPSRVMYRLGQWIMRGLGLGVEDETPEVERTFGGAVAGAIGRAEDDSYAVIERAVSPYSAPEREPEQRRTAAANDNGGSRRPVVHVHGGLHFHGITDFAEWKATFYRVVDDLAASRATAEPSATDLFAEPT